MGISPYYRGTDCNFWALYDGNPELVGATIHLLSKGLDSGKILAHATSEEFNDPFVYTMSTVKSAFFLIEKIIKNKTFKKVIPIMQNKKLEIRYSRLNEFNEKTLRKYNKKKLTLKHKKKFKLYNQYQLKQKFYLNLVSPNF